MIQNIFYIIKYKIQNIKINFELIFLTETKNF